jgi:PST family polysaccharide transporter
LSGNLTARTIRGTAWTLSTSLGARVLGLAGTLVLVRFLAPEDYGEVMVAATLTVTAFSITSLGVGIYVLSNRDLTRADMFHASCWFLATGVVGQALLWILCASLAHWFDAPALGRYLPMFVIAALIDRLTFMPERMLIRELRFRRTAIARAAGELVFTASSLVLAWRGAGAMAIAWANLARALLRAAAIVPAVSWRTWLEPHRLRGPTLAKIAVDGSTIWLSGIATFLMRRWDNLVVGAQFGNAAMGAYNYAYNLADTPSVAIGEQLTDVVAASFPHAEPAKRRDAVVRACTMTSLVMLPLAIGLGTVADTVGEAFFARQWASVGPMLMYLSILSAPRPVAGILQMYLFAEQRRRMVAAVEWMSLVVLLAGMATVGRISVLVTCGVVGAVFALRTLALMWIVQRLDGIPVRSFLAPLVRPLVACAAMAATIRALRPTLVELGLAPVAQLGVEVAVGAGVYLAGAVVVFRPAAAELLTLARTRG